MYERCVFLLAAGRGSRLNLDVPKSMAPLGGKPILDHTIEHLSGALSNKPVCIVGYQSEVIQRHYGGDVVYRKQEELNGNAGAILAGIDIIPTTGSCMVVQGDDSAFVSSETYLKVYQVHERSSAKITVLLSQRYDPDTQHRFCEVDNGGRIISCKKIDWKKGKPKGGFFTGVYCFEPGFLRDNLARLVPDTSGEIGIPQLIELALAKSEKVVAVWDKNDEWLSINTKKELEIANYRLSVFHS